MKEWKCVKVDNYRDVGKTIEEYQGKGWRLYSYQASGLGKFPVGVPEHNHYMLFERGTD